MSLAACSSSGTSQFESLTIKTSTGTHTFSIELADTARKRQVGLMERTDLNEDQGMLFIFPALSLNPFWMKNTPLSLDIIFIDSDARVLQIAAKTVPYSKELIQAEQPYLYVLEVLAGTVKTIDLQVGDLLISDAF
jgi:uncharacterized membrane protein (UPF0127 family)